jgi:hypothetical protein
MGVRHKCRAKDCDREARVRCLCMRHYMQVIRHGRLTPSTRRTECLVIGCNKQHTARGYCQTHYKQLMRYGKILNGKKPTKKTCSIVNCKNEVWSKGLCNKHHRHYLFAYVHKGSSWEDVDRIVADFNQKFLAQRNRLDMIKERHRILLHAKEAYIRKQALQDMLEDSVLGPDEISMGLADLDVPDDSAEEKDRGDEDNALDRVL